MLPNRVRSPTQPCRVFQGNLCHDCSAKPAIIGVIAKPSRRFHPPLFGFSGLVAVSALASLALWLDQFVVPAPVFESRINVDTRIASPATCCPRIPPLRDLSSDLNRCPAHGVPLTRSKVRYSRRSYREPSIPEEVASRLFPFALPRFASPRWRTWHEGTMVEFSRCPDCAMARWRWLEERGEKNVDRSLPKAGEIDWSGFAIPLEPPVEASSPPNLEFAPLPVP